MFCRQCGTNNDENAKYCVSCGEPMVEQVTGTIVSQKRELCVGQLIWSIISLVFLFMPLGIASLILTITAQDAKTDEDEANALKKAKTCNIIATVLASVFYVFALGMMLLPFLFICLFI